VEHSRSFRDSHWADPAEYDEDRTYKDLSCPDVADSREAGYCAEHEDTQLRCHAVADVLGEVSNGQIAVHP
jgi:hypothetical protein